MYTIDDTQVTANIEFSQNDVHVISDNDNPNDATYTIDHNQVVDDNLSETNYEAKIENTENSVIAFQNKSVEYSILKVLVISIVQSIRWIECRIQ